MIFFSIRQNKFRQIASKLAMGWFAKISSLKVFCLLHILTFSILSSKNCFLVRFYCIFFIIFHILKINHTIVLIFELNKVLEIYLIITVFSEIIVPFFYTQGSGGPQTKEYFPLFFFLNNHSVLYSSIQNMTLFCASDNAFFLQE